jgi:hypothetical protein
MKRREGDALVVPNQGLGDHIEHNGMVRYISEIYKGNVYYFVGRDIFLGMVKWMYRDNPRIKIVPLNMPKNLPPFSNARAEFLNCSIREFLWWSDSDRMGFAKFDEQQSGEKGYRNAHQHQPWTEEATKLTAVSATHNGWSKHYKPLECGRAYYHTAGIPYQVKFDNFYLERDYEEEDRVYKKLNPNNEKYVFVHDEIGKKINLNTEYKVIRNDPTENIFYQIGLLKKAEEIHCMSSCVMLLVDCLAASPMKTSLSEKPKFFHWYVRRRKLDDDHGKHYLGSEWKVLYDKKSR